MFIEHSTEEIINLIDLTEKKINEEMEMPRKKEEPKENVQTEDNKIEISIGLKKYDEVITKLEKIKALLSEIRELEVKDLMNSTKILKVELKPGIYAIDFYNRQIDRIA